MCSNISYPALCQVNGGVYTTVNLVFDTMHSLHSAVIYSYSCCWKMSLPVCALLVHGWAHLPDPVLVHGFHRWALLPDSSRLVVMVCLEVAQVWHKCAAVSFGEYFQFPAVDYSTAVRHPLILVSCIQLSFEVPDLISLGTLS